MTNRNVDLRVEGLEHLPRSGPMLVAARHFHHLYDGCILLSTLPRPSHILVAADWATNPLTRRVLDATCKAAEWPQVLRTDGPSKIDELEAARMFRRAITDSIGLFRRGHSLIVFPEGYPNIDPGYTPKADESAFLPFQRGFVRLATTAAREGLIVPIVPIGLDYQRGQKWHVQLRIGKPITVKHREEEATACLRIQASVENLSRAH